ERQRQLLRIGRTRAARALQAHLFNSRFGRFTLYGEAVSTAQVALRGILVSDERDPTLSRIISAREGRLLTDEVNQRVTLRMLDGAINEADILPVNVPKTTNLDGAAPTGGAAGASRYRYTRFDLYDQSLPYSPLKSSARMEKPEKDLSLGELEAKIAEFKNDPTGR